MAEEKASSPLTNWGRTIWGELSAELLGTFILVLIGDGSVAMAVAALNQSGRGTAIGAGSGGALWLLITWGWGFGVVFGVYVAGAVSGGHINPAVTLALAVKRDFPWRKVVPYWVAQTVGAFAAAALIYLVYNAAISSYEQAHHITRGATNSIPSYSIFATFPAPYFTSTLGPFIDQIVGTGLLVLFIFALLDTMNQPPRANLAPFLIGLAVVVIGMSFGANAGYAINPARDFGPRVWAWLAGWGKVAFPGPLDYWWVPIAGPLIGGVLGGLCYDFFIGNVLKARQQQPEPGVEARGRTVAEDPSENEGDQ